MWINLVDNLPNVRYWSEVLCCTISTHLSDIEVNVMGFEIIYIQVFGECAQNSISRELAAGSLRLGLIV